jgi:hypothetical protein
MSTSPSTIELDIPRSARERAFRALAHEIARDNIVTDALQRLIEQIIREIEESRIAPLRAALEKIANRHAPISHEMVDEEMNMTLQEALRFDAREPNPLGVAKTMASRLIRAADEIDDVKSRCAEIDRQRSAAAAENERLRELLRRVRGHGGIEPQLDIEIDAALAAFNWV